MSAPNKELTSESPEVLSLANQFLDLCNGHSHEDICKAWYWACTLTNMEDFTAETAESIAHESPELETFVDQLLDVFNGHTQEEITLALTEHVYWATMMGGVFSRNSVSEAGPFPSCDGEDSPRIMELTARLLDACDGYTHDEITRASGNACEITGKKGVFFREGATKSNHMEAHI